MADRRREPSSAPPSGLEPQSDAELEPPTDPRATLPGPDRADESLARGLELRRAVLGHAHVERALASATDLDRDFQEYITRSAWGEIWSRPGLPRHTRHLLTIAMLAALDRQEELELHLRATVNTGVTLEEVKEVLMQVAVYAGVPAANSAMRTAKRVFSEPPTPGGD